MQRENQIYPGDSEKTGSEQNYNHRRERIPYTAQSVCAVFHYAVYKVSCGNYKQPVFDKRGNQVGLFRRTVLIYKDFHYWFVKNYNEKPLRRTEHYHHYI